MEEVQRKPTFLLSVFHRKLLNVLKSHFQRPSETKEGRLSTREYLVKQYLSLVHLTIGSLLSRRIYLERPNDDLHKYLSDVLLLSLWKWYPKTLCRHKNTLQVSSFDTYTQFDHYPTILLKIVRSIEYLMDPEKLNQSRSNPIQILTTCFDPSETGSIDDFARCIATEWISPITTPNDMVVSANTFSIENIGRMIGNVFGKKSRHFVAYCNNNNGFDFTGEHLFQSKESNVIVNLHRTRNESLHRLLTSFPVLTHTSLTTSLDSLLTPHSKMNDPRFLKGFHIIYTLWLMDAYQNQYDVVNVQAFVNVFRVLAFVIDTTRVSKVFTRFNEYQKMSPPIPSSNLCKDTVHRETAKWAVEECLKYPLFVFLFSTSTRTKLFRSLFLRVLKQMHPTIFSSYMLSVLYVVVKLNKC